ncbi:MAG: recombination mediator RecR [Actinomycetota bacterium]|nr:recombination mediator RecR [Actinomycetota bacterium]
MPLYLEAVENLINEFRRLPAIGPKSARRIVFYLLSRPKKEIDTLAEALVDMKNKVSFCRQCHNLSQGDICLICSNQGRDRSKICVVQSPSDVAIIESTGEYRGLYHVLGGLLSPIEDVGPEQIKIPSLVKRIEQGDVHEVILALNPTVEGESTAMYIRKLLGTKDIETTRLASGLPVGGDLEYADELTLGRAITNRGKF